MQETLQYKSGISTHGRTREAELKPGALDRSAILTFIVIIFQRPLKMNCYFLYWEEETMLISDQ
jgi:hypothetical protein